MFKHISILVTLLGLFITVSTEAETMHPSTQTKVYPVAIIGAGAGGTMATERAILNNREVLLFTGAKPEKKRSRGHWVRAVHNIPGLTKYTRALVELQQETLAHIASGPFQHNLSVVEDSVVSIEKQAGLFKLVDKTGQSYLAKYVILATGMMDEQPHIGGSIRPILKFGNNQSVAYCIMCDGHRSLNKKTVVIGHSEEAAKAALLLAERYQPSKLTILTNGKAPEFT
ncbi:MAG: NAD(P)/FAD-dependent oxidoreductase, partial [Verrucomicrobia bacterium]|nr:NAD(P)/FAD-dependent oxidoreductase [Verrucomicrobiota bacterium]